MARLSDYAKKVYPTAIAGVYVKNCTFDELEEFNDEFEKLKEEQGDELDGYDRTVMGFKYFLRDENGEEFEDCKDKESLKSNHSPMFVREVDEEIGRILGGGDPKKG